MSGNPRRVVTGSFLLLAGVVAATLIVWLSHLVSVPLATLLTAGAVIIALSWLVILTTVPWNLYFAAKRAAQEMAVSRERGIAVRPGDDQEAGRISRQMLRFALSAQLGTALAATAIAFWSANRAGYYISAIALLSTAFRPAVAYFRHLRERVTRLSRESTYPRADVATLLTQVAQAEQAAGELRHHLRTTNEDLRRTEAALTDAIAHARQVLTDDLNRLQDGQAADRAAARSRDDVLERRIDQMTRRIEATVDGISDQQELLSGLRALVRMVRSDPALGSRDGCAGPGERVLPEQRRDRAGPGGRRVGSSSDSPKEASATGRPASAALTSCIPRVVLVPFSPRCAARGA